MPTTLRPVQPGDGPAVAQLNAEVHALHQQAHPDLFKPLAESTFVETVFPEMLERPNTFCLVAEENALPVGYVYGEVLTRPDAWYRPQLRVLYIHQLSVRGTHRRRGVATLLMQACVARAQQEGIRRLELDTFAFNATARRFFARHGFTDMNIRMARTLPPADVAG